MKKFALLLIFIILSNCEVKTRQVQANNKTDYTFYTEKHNGMTYGIWWNDGYNSNREDALFIVNLTKDSLEVEVLKKQLVNK